MSPIDDYKKTQGAEEKSRAEKDQDLASVSLPLSQRLANLTAFVDQVNGTATAVMEEEEPTTAYVAPPEEAPKRGKGKGKVLKPLCPRPNCGQPKAVSAKSGRMYAYCRQHLNEAVSKKPKVAAKTPRKTKAKTVRAIAVRVKPRQQRRVAKKVRKITRSERRTAPTAYDATPEQVRQHFIDFVAREGWK